MSSVGDMLRLARQRLGFTQKAASSQLGIPQPVLSRFENGVAEPDGALLSKAARVYDIPKEFFDLKEPVYGPPVSVHPMPRAKADVTARDLDMVTAELNIRAMQLRRFLEAVDFKPTHELPFLDVESYGSPQKVAALLRAHWNLPPGPIKNLTAVVERAGAVVGLSDFGGASVSGMTFRVPGQPPLILINADHPADRMRFTLAHELGHLVEHRFPTPSMEPEANEFASEFLMPAADIHPYFAGRRITLELLAALKPEWRVSMQALLRRSKDLGYTDQNQYRYLMQRISQRGWRLREPPELDFEREHPMVISSIINAHIKDLGYTLTDLTKFVPMYEREFSRLYGDIGGQTPGPRLRLVM
ncbi:Zn-dependent peptidase ImmA (M78 family)/transcriptional regulator with XRE-family HTH domain [Inquilinus ginsengisoli]|uniref:Zn-dependent peptidase ImmA (M78 family)/transcriptional regulator with XRE-family HTH domain n=1 Tax=Inquilinus ginsengisoli TaxID=363840 RepID=A0ABU1JYU7_9PROT|nr:XRE family transcriptional regulator [Inquilinus ginsengisoli]MDR6293797.1 Zn-dependent peptidase ImmA (M78 family)/transcriptional regulator with XRE-family HTH domain [Inquilinus ginsengisoli]